MMNSLYMTYCFILRGLVYSILYFYLLISFAIHVLILVIHMLLINDQLLFLAVFSCLLIDSIKITPHRMRDKAILNPSVVASCKRSNLVL